MAGKAHWVGAFHLTAASKKGISSKQLQRMFSVTYKTASFMSHRICEAMTPINPAPLGGEDKIVEADTAYHGRAKIRIPSPARKGRPFTKAGKSGGGEKQAIVAQVERGGEFRAVAMTAKRVTPKNVREVLLKHAYIKSRLHTDESVLYLSISVDFATHETVKHSIKKYARGNVTTNSVEGFFGVFKRGFNGTYQHCGEQHFQR